MEQNAFDGAAVRAAVETVNRLGVRDVDPEILSNGYNLLVHLRPLPLVARVATVTAAVRSEVTSAIEREIAVATFLDNAGVDVVAPSDIVPPGPHSGNGFSVSFWKYVEVDRTAVVTPDQAGGLLRELHEALRQFPRVLPFLSTPFGDISDVLARPQSLPSLTERDSERIRSDLARVYEVVRDYEHQAQVLHGDAHPGNLIKAGGRWLWTDFEDTCGGPLLWDLAVLAVTNRLDGQSALRSYGRVSMEELDPFIELRLLHQVVWVAAAADHRPEQRQASLDFLQAWRNGPESLSL